MKNFLFFCTFALIISCNDGDLTIETIDFDSITSVQACSTTTTSTTVFFKINDSEALILELESGLLKNEVSTEDISSSVPSNSQITYRAFSDGVSSDYFCDAIPTTTPSVEEEIEATAGQVLITTTLKEGTTDTFEHYIQLSGITFITSNDQRITDLQINEFGTVTTKQ